MNEAFNRKIKSMKTTFGIILLVFFAVNLNAQERKFTFGANVYGNYSTGLVINSKATDAAAYGGSLMEQPKLSISADMVTNYQFNEKLSLGFGIGFQNTGDKVKMDDLIFQQQSSANPTAVRFKYNYNNIELPIYLRIHFANRFFTQVGASYTFNVSNMVHQTIYYDDKSKERKRFTDKSTDFRRSNIFVHIGIGGYYYKGERLKLSAQLVNQFGILGVSTSAPVNRNMFSCGLKLGLEI